ncbi:MAG: reactive intermediate/imine deaminase [Anaerolinea sp.]|nr:reactive intermediate/imine deaminase [Anaerolinea sp.]
MLANKKVISADKAPKAIGPYSHAIQAGDFVYTSGQLGFDPATGALVEGGVEAQARQALINLGAVLTAAGCDFSQVVKTTVFLKDINDFARVNAIYGEFFAQEPPARSAVQVAALPKDGLVEIEAVAFSKVAEKA